MTDTVLIITLLTANLALQAATFVQARRQRSATRRAAGRDDEPAMISRGRAAYVLDSCGLIDGRIAAIVEAGFLPGELLVPDRVLGELQRLADTADSATRRRARHGLDTVRQLQQGPAAVRVISDDLPADMPVDDVITELARRHGASLYTTDHNLIEVAAIRRVPSLNVNRLALALRPSCLPGETIRLKIVRKGDGRGQGIGHTDDGTMVVVEDGALQVGRSVEAVVSRLLQTDNGQMLFASLKKRA